MADTTPELGLTLPGGGSTGTITPPDRVDIDVLNDNFRKIDTFAAGWGPAAEQNQQYVGPAALIGTIATPKDGDEYQESDGNKTLWRREGGTWVTWTPYGYLIRPSGVAGTGAAINADGSVDPGSGTSIRVNGVFSTRFEHYKIVGYMTFGSGSANNFEFAEGSTVLNGSGNYVAGGLGINNSTTVTGYSSSTVNNIPISPGNGNQHNFEILVMNPCVSGRRKFIQVSSYCQNVNTQAFAFQGGGGTTSAALNNQDGFRINPGSAISGGKIEVFGIR